MRKNMNADKLLKIAIDKKKNFVNNSDYNDNSANYLNRIGEEEKRIDLFSNYNNNDSEEEKWLNNKLEENLILKTDHSKLKKKIPKNKIFLPL